MLFRSQSKMLKELNYQSLDDLIDNTVPEKIKFKGELNIGEPNSDPDIGDAVLCRIQEVEETHSSVVTMKGMGLRKIRSGVVEEIDPHLLGRLIGKGGDSLRRLKAESQCRIVVADNGRMWIDGELDGILEVREKLSEISDRNNGGER